MQHSTEKPITNDIIQNQKLKRCLLYARSAVRDPFTRKYYKARAKRRQTAFNAAFIDAYYPPKIRGIVLDYFSGKAGDPIIVRATDRFRVKEVRFKLFDAFGMLIEQGIGCRQKNQKDFIFTIKKDIPFFPGLHLKVIAVDMTINKTCVERLL